jgi:S-methylmethionine-dependent homocysteine/selenocysteine methylase
MPFGVPEHEGELRSPSPGRCAGAIWSLMTCSPPSKQNRGFTRVYAVVISSHRESPLRALVAAILAYRGIIRVKDAEMTVVEELSRRLADGEVVVIDGAMGTELQARGVPMDDEAWSGLANLTHDHVVQAIHEDYIRAGADVIIANTYAAARLPFERAGYGDRVVEANRRAVRAARQARDRAADRPVAIAGSMSFAAAEDVVLRGRPGPTGTELLEHYREQASALAEGGVDLIALEMINSPSFGSPALEAAAETGLPVWLGVSVEVAVDGHVATLDRPQEGLDELLEALLGSTVSAVTVMHSVIEAVPPALDVIARLWSGPVGAYPHCGDYKPPEWIFGDITPEAFASASASWVDRGAQLVGGCCGIRPEHIRALADNLPDRPPEDAGRAPAA